MVVFTLVGCAEGYKYEAMDSLINIGEAIIKKGHKIVGIFLYGSGVHNIKGERKLSASDQDLPKKLNEFCHKNGIELIGCSTWISFTGIKKNEFIEQANQEGLGGLSYFLANSDRAIFFGPGA